MSKYTVVPTEAFAFHTNASLCMLAGWRMSRFGERQLWTPGFWFSLFPFVDADEITPPSRSSSRGLSDLCNSFQLTTYFHNVIWKSYASEPGRVLSQPLFLKTNLNWRAFTQVSDASPDCPLMVPSPASLPNLSYLGSHSDTYTTSPTPPRPMVSHTAPPVLVRWVYHNHVPHTGWPQ